MNLYYVQNTFTGWCITCTPKEAKFWCLLSEFTRGDYNIVRAGGSMQSLFASEIR